MTPQDLSIELLELSHQAVEAANFAESPAELQEALQAFSGTLRRISYRIRGEPARDLTEINRFARL